jgi:hypothetical protein
MPPGRRLFVSLLAAVTIAAIAAPSALAAPTLEVTLDCSNPDAPNQVSATVHGLLPNQQFVGTLQFPSGDEGTSNLTADANGDYGPFVFGGGPGTYTFSVTPSGGARISKSVVADCPSVEAGGGSVSVDADSYYAAGTPMHITIDASSGPAQEHPAGTVTERFGNTELHGAVTCVSVSGMYAAVGVTLDDPPAGIPAGQLLDLTRHGAQSGALHITTLPEGPAPCRRPANVGGFSIDGPIDFRSAQLDSEPPEIRVPERTELNATRPWGARARYVVVAIDDLDLTPELDCRPDRGARLPIGRTTVECAASDDGGNTSAASFDVRVKGAYEQFTDLRAVVAGYHLPLLLDRRLRGPLVISQVLQGWHRKRPACKILGGFAETAASESGYGLTRHQAGRLLADAARMRGAMGCEPPAPRPRTPTIRVVPACGGEEADAGTLDYGASFELAGFAANAPLDVRATTTSGIEAPLQVTTDVRGHWGPWAAGASTPLTTVTVTASEPGGAELARAELADPCLAAVLPR